MTDQVHIDSQLDVFALALNWKGYFRRLIGEYVGGEVLEVGAGIGETTRVLCRGEHARWVCLEPNPAQAEQIGALVGGGQLPKFCEVRAGTLADVPPQERFDTVLYIDVLEHIEGDREEAERAAARLRSGGHLVVLAPAHQALYTPFDEIVGHHRRYTKETLSAVIPASLRRRELSYVDAVGALASVYNRLILKSSTPTRQQILFWDRLLVPLSRVVDPLFGYRLGKTVIGVWRKE
jgi:2-polyprenyl-3-methyl-5-hydroxy-6-metoxy-1,4-benzoquinol methylase